MADSNFSDEQIDQLMEALGRLTNAANRTSDELDEYGNVLTEEQVVARRHQKALDELQKKELEKTENQIKALENATKSFINFNASLTAAPGSFGPMKQVVGAATDAVSKLASSFGPLGKAIGGVVSAFGEVAKFVVDQFEKAYGTFEKLSETGIVTTFESMTQSANAMGLTFADTDRVLTKASKDLAMLGGSAIKGREEFEKLAISSETARRDFQKLGISAADFSEFQLSYVAQQQRYNKGQTKSLDELKTGSETYIKELDALSKLTGVSRKQLQAEQEARMRDVRYRAGIASLREDERKEINNFLGVLKNVAPDIEEGMKDLIASGGVPVTEAGKAAMLALQQGGLNVQEVVNGLRSGSLKGFEAFQRVAGAAGKAADSTEHLAKITGDQTAITKTFVSLRELEARKADMTQEEYDKLRKEIEKNATATTGQNANLANAKQSMYNAGRNIEQLSVSSEVATKALSLMGDGIEYMTEKMYELAGKELPAHLKARREERKAIEEDAKAKQKITELEKELAEGKEKYESGQMGYLEKGRYEQKQRALQDAKFEQSKKERAVAESKQKRIAAEKAAGVERPEDKKAAEKAAMPKELQTMDEEIAKKEQENQRLKAIADGETLKIQQNDEKIKELKIALAKAEKEGKTDEINQLKEKQAEALAEQKVLLDAKGDTAKRILEYEDSNKKLEEARKKRAEKEIELKAQEAKGKPSAAPAPAPSPAPSPAPAAPAPAPAAPAPAPAPAPSTARPAPSAGGKPTDTAGLLSKLKESGITDPKAQANILAQVQAESGFVPRSEELGKYSAKTLYNMYGPEQKKNKVRFKSLEEAQELVAQGPEAVGEVLYGGRMGNVEKGDGFKYRGRGLIQLTGKDNYAKYGKMIGVDLVKEPDLANDPDIAQKLAVAYFKEKEKRVDLTDISAVGKAVGYAGGEKETEKRKRMAEEHLKNIPQAANGGIFSGPDTGYPAILHGTEAVVPLSGKGIKSVDNTGLDKISEPMQQIFMSGYQQMQESNSKSIEKFDRLIEMFSAMTEKLTDAVDLLEDSKKIQNNLLSNAMN